MGNMWGTWEKHVGNRCEKPMGNTCETYGKHLGNIWETRGNLVKRLDVGNVWACGLTYGKPMGKIWASSRANPHGSLVITVEKMMLDPLWANQMDPTSGVTWDQ